MDKYLTGDNLSRISHLTIIFCIDLQIPEKPSLVLHQQACKNKKNFSGATLEPIYNANFPQILIVIDLGPKNMHNSSYRKGFPPLSYSHIKNHLLCCWKLMFFYDQDINSWKEFVQHPPLKEGLFDSNDSIPNIIQKDTFKSSFPTI